MLQQPTPYVWNGSLRGRMAKDLPKVTFGTPGFFHDALFERGGGSYSVELAPGTYDVVAIDPVPCPGNRKLWPVPPPIAAAVRAAEAAARLR
jgi:hypothetical protein